MLMLGIIICFLYQRLGPWWPPDTNLLRKNYFASLHLPRYLLSTIRYYYLVWSDLTRKPQQLACNNGVKRLCTVVLLL